jgi:hypothetical protein
MAMARRGATLCILLALGACAGRSAHAGNLTSIADLDAIARAAQQGSASASASLAALHAEAIQSWRWGQVSGSYVTTLQGDAKACHPESAPGQTQYLKEGAPDAYAKVLAYHLRTEPDEASRLALAAEARERVLDLVDTRGFSGLDGLDWSASNQCILELGISIPVWIETALLLAETPVWKPADRAAFAHWLAQEVYPKVAWASRVRRNNWGAAGSLSASLIARYLNGEVAALTEVKPTARTIDPSTAWHEHDAMQLRRIHTQWAGDSQCASYGIQNHGGIPDELRRGAGGCTATSIPSADDPALSYQAMHVELLVYHAEALRREGSSALYDAETDAGARAIHQAILFVIANPTPGGHSWPWGVRSGAALLAFRAYGDPRLAQAAASGSTFRGGRTLPYAALTLPPPPNMLDEATPLGPAPAGGAVKP